MDLWNNLALNCYFSDLKICSEKLQSLENELWMNGKKIGEDGMIATASLRS